MDWSAKGVDSEKGCLICAVDVVSVWEINGKSDQIVYVHFVGPSVVDGILTANSLPSVNGVLSGRNVGGGTRC